MYRKLRNSNVQYRYLELMDGSEAPIRRFFVCKKLTGIKPVEHGTPEDEPKGKPTSDKIGVARATTLAFVHKLVLQW